MRTYPELKQILEFWEKGMSKKWISIQLDIPRATVRDCIYRYGTVANLEAVMRGETPKPPDIISPQLEPRKLIVPSFKPRIRRYTDDDLKEAIVVTAGGLSTLAYGKRIPATKMLSARISGGAEKFCAALTAIISSNG